MVGILKLRTESASEQYMNEMHEQFHCFATWLPGIPLQIGDIGELKHNEFTYISNLHNKGISFTVRTDPSGGDLSHQSSGGITTVTKLNGDVAVPQFNLNVADAGIIVQFGSKKGVVFEAAGVKHQLITEVDTLDNAIKDAYKKGKWKDNWVVISDLMVADSTTVLISEGKDAAVGLKAKSTVPHLSLANLDANFEMIYANNMNTNIICQSGLTPLFKVRGIIKKPGLFGSLETGGIKGLGRKESKIPQPPHTESRRTTVGEIEYKPFH